MKRTIVTCLLSILLMYKVKAQNLITNQEKGFFNITSLNIGYGIYHADGVDSIGKGYMPDGVMHDNVTHISSRNKDVSSIGISTVNGYFIISQFSVGLGLAFNRYTAKNYTLLPVFADLRYYLKNDTKTIFVYSDLGYSIDLDGNKVKSYSGSLLELGMGYKFMIVPKLGMNANIGYVAQRINDNNPDIFRDQIKKPLIGTLKLQVGILF